MNAEAKDYHILRLHKTWADRYTLFWQVFILILFSGIYVLLDQTDIDPAERASAFVLLASMVLAAAVWQAVGLGVARVHMLLAGVDLNQRSNRHAR
jgi:hypothetical protein